jgi:MFS family permease
VQGLGSALMTPVGRILVLRNVSKSELLNATAPITWPALFAPVIGPVLGGFITTYLSWHWNFFINFRSGWPVWRWSPASFPATAIPKPGRSTGRAFF